MSTVLFFEKDSRGKITAKKFTPCPKPSSPSLTDKRPYHPPGPPLPRDPYGGQSFPRRMPSPSEDPWSFGPGAYGHPSPFPLRAIGRATSVENESRARRRSLSKHYRRELDSQEDISSVAVSPGTRLTPRCTVPSNYYVDPPIPFVAAAQQLDRTIRRAITFFDNFHLTFRESSDDLKFHANQELLNKIWQSQINSSRTSPTHDWYNRKSKRPNSGDDNSNYQQNNGYQQNMNGNNMNMNGSNNNSRNPSPAAEVLSFREYQQQVLSRVEAVMHSKDPIMPMVARHCVPSSPYGGDDESDHDAELSESRARQHVSATLKRKVTNCYDDLREAVEGMGKDHVFAKQAIREMKVIKQQLVTYSQAWDERWEDNGGWDSDEDERDWYGRGRC